MFTPFAFVKSAAAAPVAGFSGSGGTITTSGSYSYMAFTSSGTLVVDRSGLVDVLMVGGGGGGSSGGGAGGSVLYVSGYTIPLGSYPITGGAGGAGADNDSANGVSGSATEFYTGSTLLAQAKGGGGGAKDNNNGAALLNGGAAGAGGGSPPYAGGAATTGNFFTPSGSASSVNDYPTQAGGGMLSLTYYGFTFPAAGGGGSNQAGFENQTQQFGSGDGSGGGGNGIGLANWSSFGEVSGSLNYFGGGGGGRRSDGANGYAAPGGLGGGGDGNINNANANSGSANTGGGSGGNAGAGSNPADGGSGVFILRWLT